MTTSITAVVPRTARDATPFDLTHLTGELHDTVAHALSGIALAAAGACRALGDAAAPVVSAALPAATQRDTLLTTVRTIEACAVEAMTDLHGLLGLLRDVAGAPGRPEADQPGWTQRWHRLGELESLVGRARDAGLSVALDVRGHPQALDRRVEHAAYRVVQEGLTNAIKYAGRPARAGVRLSWSGHWLDVGVRTYGAHHEPRLGGTGQGLAGLAHRVIGLGGRFTAGPDGLGFRTEALLPTEGPRPAGLPAGLIGDQRPGLGR